MTESTVDATTEARIVRAAIEALALYTYNLSPQQWVEDVFPGRHPDYVAEKTRLAARSFASFYGALDLENQRRCADAIWERYGNRAMARVSGSVDH